MPPKREERAVAAVPEANPRPTPAAALEGVKKAVAELANDGWRFEKPRHNVQVLR